MAKAARIYPAFNEVNRIGGPNLYVSDFGFLVIHVSRHPFVLGRYVGLYVDDDHTAMIIYRRVGDDACSLLMGVFY